MLIFIKYDTRMKMKYTLSLKHLLIYRKYPAKLNLKV